jgi:hypothetical protein
MHVINEQVRIRALLEDSCIPVDCGAWGLDTEPIGCQSNTLSLWKSKVSDSISVLQPVRNTE